MMAEGMPGDTMAHSTVKSIADITLKEHVRSAFNELGPSKLSHCWNGIVKTILGLARR